MQEAPRHNFELSAPLRGTESIKWNTYPEDVLPLWVADTDFLCPQPVLDAITDRVRLGILGYPKITESFGKAVAYWMETRFGWKIEPEWVVFASAIVPGLVDTIEAFTEPGDKVVIQSPVYPPFHQVILESGRGRVMNPMRHENGVWSTDFSDLESKLEDPAVKMMFLCSPHNPIGRVIPEKELRTISALCLKHKVLLVSDEIHGDVVYPPHRHMPLPMVSEAASDASVVFVNPSKTFNIPGMRAAAAIIPNAAYRECLRKTSEARKSAEPSVLGPIALQTAYTRCGWYADQLLEYLQGNRDFAVKYIEENIPRIRVQAPQATFLLWLDCRNLEMDQDGLVSFMLQKAKVALNSGVDFGQEGAGFMRMNIACQRATLEAALVRIRDAVNGLK